jgi:micrococcal nuclease
MAGSKIIKTIMIGIVFFFILSCSVSCGVLLANDMTESHEKNNSKKEILVNKSFLVTEVIDGDTLLLEKEICVRLIGINTPEKDMFYYEEAKQALKTIIQDKQVTLEKDITDKDIYGRYLRYVFLGQHFINLEMVKRGFANVFTVPPDVKYTDKFLKAEREARDKQWGLWHISKYASKEMVKNIYTGAGNADKNSLDIFLNYDAEGNDTENINGEFVKITNNLNFDINIDGWTVKDGATNIYEFKNYILGKGDFLILYSGCGNDNSSCFYWNSNKPVWNNQSDSLYLRDKEGYLVSVYNY